MILSKLLVPFLAVTTASIKEEGPCEDIAKYRTTNIATNFNDNFAEGFFYENAFQGDDVDTC